MAHQQNATKTLIEETGLQKDNHPPRVPPPSVDLQEDPQVADNHLNIQN